MPPKGRPPGAKNKPKESSGSEKQKIKKTPGRKPKTPATAATTETAITTGPLGTPPEPLTPTRTSRELSLSDVKVSKGQRRRENRKKAFEEKAVAKEVQDKLRNQRALNPNKILTTGAERLKTTDALLDEVFKQKNTKLIDELEEHLKASQMKRPDAIQQKKQPTGEQILTHQKNAKKTLTNWYNDREHGNLNFNDKQKRKLLSTYANPTEARRKYLNTTIPK